MDYMEMEKSLCSIQCGCRQGKSTMDHLVRMENEILKAFALNEQFVYLYFDLEKAYDMTWRYGIMRDLRGIGLRVYMPKFIEHFLKNKTFKVRLQNICSNTHQQHNRVLLGSVLSVKLFALKINSIIKCIPHHQRPL